MGKYSPLDFETAEPINALDGLLKKTHCTYLSCRFLKRV